MDVDMMLDWLDNESFINRYRIDDESFIQVCKFHVHQKPHHMEAESTIPPPPGSENKFRAKPLYKRQRERILARDGHRCRACGATKKLHIDHIVPVSKGGTSDDGNLQVLCEKCNTSKGAKTDDKSLTNRQGIVNESSATVLGSLIPDSLNLNTVPIGTGASAPKNANQQNQDPKTQIWNAGENMLGSRALVGKLVKAHGEANVLHAIAQTITAAPADPKAYINGILRGGNDKGRQTRNNGAAQRGEDFGAECWSRINGDIVD
jgi:hypothetical protein